MRIGSVAALLVSLCLWIPAAQSQYSATPPEDEDSSGDDLEMSGSGSGDNDSILDPDFRSTDVTTQSITNATKTAWVTDAPVKVPEQTVTQLSSTVIPLADVETAGLTTVALLPHTTKIPETQPSPTTVKSLVHVKEVPVVETTTIAQVDEEEEDTTTLPEEKLPVATEQPTIVTTPVDIKEETTVKAVLVVKEEEETTIPDEDTDPSTVAADMEYTTMPLATSSSKVAADSDSSGDTVVSTTVQATVDEGFIENNMIPDTNSEIDPQIPDDGDFDFENEIKSRKAPIPESESTMSASNEDGSLLERTEVLAGVIAGGLVGLAFAIMLVALMVYRMKKKDEGSYSLDEHKHPNGGYQKPKAQEEFLA